MKKNLRRAVVITGASAAMILIPAGVAFAATNGHGPHRTGDPAATCTYDQDQLRLRDGTGVRHDQQSTTAGQGSSYQSGPMDGSGPTSVRPLDGTGNQWGR